MTKQTVKQHGKLFSPVNHLLFFLGLFLNIALSRLVIVLGLPLYIDNVGSILVASLVGAMPAMTIGFVSNLIGSSADPLSMYYGILTIIIAWLSSVFSRRGVFRTWKGWLKASGCFVLIGGGVGSMMTWLLYGGGIGGIGAPYARILCAWGVPDFLAQLTVDMIIDIPDKLITVGLVCLLLRLYPKKWAGLFPMSYLYDHSSEASASPDVVQVSPYHHTVKQRLSRVVGAMLTIVCVLFLVISTHYYEAQLFAEYESAAQSVAYQAVDELDAVAEQLTDDSVTTADTSVKENLQRILVHENMVGTLRVFQANAAGCSTVLALNDGTQSTVGADEDLNDVNERLDAFLAGEAVSPGHCHTSGGGAVVTAYAPVKNTAGITVAYVCAMADVAGFKQNMLVYIIRVMSLLFALTLLAIYFTLWYVEQSITEPIRQIVAQARALDKVSPENWLDCEAWRERVPVQTGDELEELYNTMTVVDANASRSVRKLIETEQKLVQTRELERVNAELAQTIRRADEANRAKTDFLSRMSHDIRTPLNAILGTVALAKDEMKNPARMREYLSTIEESGHFLLGLINDVLDINKIEQGTLELHPEPFAMDEFVHAVEKTIRPLADKKHIDFRFEINCGHRLIVVDKLRYKQIFFNLLSNAIKYTPEGGHITFLAELMDAPEGMVGIRNYVRDDGIGMSEEYMKHLYEPFTRDRQAPINKIEGSGLGLAIVKNIVDAMGGKICVSSSVGKGTEFVVELIVPSPKAEVAVQKASDAEGEDALRNKHILLVEDNEINTRIACKLLLKKGCIVTTAANGQEAVDTFTDAPADTFDMILMDIRMPVMDGLEATRAIRRLPRLDARTIPIVAMTANAYAEDVHLSLSAGMNAHLSKPIEPDKLYEAMVQYCIKQK